MKVGFCSLGCKVNAYETEYAINEFKKRGYEIVSFDDYAEVHVIKIRMLLLLRWVVMLRLIQK